VCSSDLVSAAVKTIGTALHRRIDDRGEPVFGAHAAGQDLELLKGIGGRGNRCRPKLVLGDVETIQDPARVQPAVSADPQVDTVGANPLPSGTDIGAAGSV